MEENVPETKPAQNKSLFNFEQVPASLMLVSLISGLVGGILSLSLFSNTGNTIGGNRISTQVVDEESAIIDVVTKTKPAIVSIVGKKRVAVNAIPDDFFFFFPFGGTPRDTNETEEREVAAGTGFFVTADGLIATNKHVVSDTAATFEVFTNDGKQYSAQVVARDPVNDLALLKISGGTFPTVSLGDSEHIKVGQRVIAIGNALGQFTNTVTTGVISGINRSIVATGDSTEPSQIEGAIQTDAAINPGNSGGPLLDLSGAVIGINSAVSSSGQALGFALPVNYLKKDIEIYQKRNVIVKPYIGVRYVMITSILQKQENLPVDQGAFITAGDSSEPAIVPGSAAEKAGLKEGDIITEISGRKLSLEKSLAQIINEFDPGEPITLKVLRGGQELNVNLTLGERSN